MGRTHPQLPRSSDSHRILEGKARHIWLVLMDPTVFAPLCREPGQWCEDLLISTITLSNRVFLDSPRLRRLRSVGHMALLLWDRRQNWAKLTESPDAEAVSVVGTVSLVHVTWEDGQPLLTPEMEVWPEPHQWARLTIMTRSSHFVFPKHYKPKRIWTDFAASRK